MGLRATVLSAGMACLLLWAAPAAAQICQYANDGECDEPGIGTAVCEAGTDTADCANLTVPDGFLYGALACAEAYCGDAWGLSVDQPTASAAHKAALRDCGENCILEVTFSRGRCLAVAVSTKHGRQGWATRSSLVEAEASAVEQCSGEDEFAGCAVVASACSSE
ncbi:MAG: DUF4189 domain-containing protein [Rhodospirillaceae bacterium]|nr:DUF4189 domain-containing protein [Rhodospirillaceae bacterium]